MATLDRLIDALRQADAAGNVEDARVLADAIRQMQAAPPKASAAEAPKERETTVAEGLARGAAPYVGGMGAGALVGGAIGGLVGGPPGAVAGAGIGARAVPIALGVQDIATGLYNAIAPQFGGGQVRPLSAGIQDVAQSAGIGRPGAPIAEAIGAGAAGAGTQAMALGRTAATYLDPIRQSIANALASARGVPPSAINPAVVEGVRNTMAAQPGTQTLAGGLAGAASGTLQAGGETDPLTLMLAGMGGAAVTPAAIAGIRAANTAVTNRLPAMLDPLATKRAQIAGERGPQLVQEMRAAPVSETGAPLTTAQASAGAEAPVYSATMEAVARQFAADKRYEMMRAQQQARDTSLTRAQPPGELDTLTQRRAEITKPMYEAAAAPSNVADVAPAQTLVKELMSANPGNRALMRELRAVNRNLFETDEAGEAVLRTNAQQISSVIDDLKASISKQENKFIKDQLSDVRDALIAGVPGYKTAQSAFRVASVPINQKTMLETLRETLSAPLGAGERAASYANAIKSLTSFKDAPKALRRIVSDAPRYKKLEDALSPAQIKVIDDVRLDLARDAKLQELVRAARGALSDPGKIGTEMLGDRGLINPLDPTIAILNRILANKKGQLNVKLAMELALESLNPKVAADALERSLARQAKFERFRLPEPAPLSAGSTAAAALPTAINALSQQQNQNAMAR